MKKLSVLLMLVLALCMCTVQPLQAWAAEESAVAKKDISAADVDIASVIYYEAAPQTPPVTVALGGEYLRQGKDYVLVYENNINVGTASVYAFGIGDYYGVAKGTFAISHPGKIIYIEGSYNGEGGGELNGSFTTRELYMGAGRLKVRIDSDYEHLAYYELYRLEGEEPVFVTSYESPAGYNGSTGFEYDFTSVYEDYAAEGGAAFMLVASWITAQNKVYIGVVGIGVYAKMPDATAMSVEQIQETDPLREYLKVSAQDGNLGNVIWSSSDSSVATVQNGVVSWKKAGTVTVTAKYGKLTATKTLTAPKLDISHGVIEAANAVSYEGYPLTQSREYTVKTITQDGVTLVQVDGCGLFAGTIMRQLDASGAPVGHTHSFAAQCAEQCVDCDFTRVTDHQFGTNWKKDQTGHWHGCTVCGKQTDYALHTFTSAAAETCTVCGDLKIPGDFTGDCEATNEDVVYLLWHTLFPESYPLSTNGDFDGSDTVTNEDVVYLLWHTLFPENYPL